MNRNYHTLDAIVVVASLILLAVFSGLLAFVDIPQAALPILASLGTGMLGIVTAYVGARWGNKKPTSSEAADTGTTVNTPPGASVVTVETPPATEPNR
jgi:hypothetical protein